MEQNIKSMQPDSGGQNNQADYDIFVSQGIKIADKMADKIEPHPESIASIMLVIVKKIETEGAKNGIVFDKSVLLNGTQEILLALLAFAEIELTEEQVKHVIGKIIGMYLQDAIKTGKMSQQEVVRYGQELQAMQQQGPQEMQQQGPQEMQQPPPEPQGLLGGANG